MKNIDPLDSPIDSPKSPGPGLLKWPSSSPNVTQASNMKNVKLKDGSDE